MRHQKGTNRMATAQAAMAALMNRAIDSFSGAGKVIAPGSVMRTTKDLEPGHSHHFKGKRSRRRRAAKMRAAGYMHVDGRGWVRKSIEGYFEEDQGCVMCTTGTLQIEDTVCLCHLGNPPCSGCTDAELVCTDCGASTVDNHSLLQA